MTELTGINVSLTPAQVDDLRAGQVVSVEVTEVYAATGERLADQPTVLFLRLAPPVYHGWVWSRWTAHPVEHVTHDPVGLQPVCGARLAVERIFLADKPSGLYPECSRCKRREEADHK